MKTGSVVSVSSHYGFAKDKEGISYYFNQRDLKGGLTMKEITIGDQLTFYPKAGPKGMIASGASKIKTFPMYEPGKKIIHSKKENPFRPHELPVNETFTRIQTMWHKSPDAARAEMDEVIQSTGANAAVNAHMLKDTWNDGNYYYSMHSYVANVGLYFVERQASVESDAKHVTENSEEYARTVHKSLIFAKEYLDKKIEEQLKRGSAFLWVAFFAIVFFVFLFGGLL